MGMHARRSGGPPVAFYLGLVTRLFQACTIVGIFTWVFRYNSGVGFSTTPKVNREGMFVLDPTKVFSWHPLLMIMGYVVFMGEALMVWREHLWFGSRYWRKTWHVAYHTAAIITIALGLTPIIVQKDIAFPLREHLYSAHAWNGVVIVALAGVQYFVGLGAFVFARKWQSPAKAMILQYHRFFGAAVFVLGTAECLGGLTQLSTEVKSRADYRRCVAVTATFVLLVGVFVMLCIYGPHQAPFPGQGPPGGAPLAPAPAKQQQQQLEEEAGGGPRGRDAAARV